MSVSVDHFYRCGIVNVALSPREPLIMFKVTARSVTRQQACWACWAGSLPQNFRLLDLANVVTMASSSYLHLGSTEQVGF